MTYRFPRPYLSVLFGLATALCFAPLASAQAPWDTIFDSDPPDPPQPGGSRGGYLCGIAPYNTGTIQGDRPTFIWQGATERVELYKDGEPEAVWDSAISEADVLERSQFEFESPLLNSVTYTVSPDVSLEPGQTYQLRIISALSSPSLRFRTLSEAEQTQIVAQREELPTADDLESSLERADYFAGAELWPQFWQEVLSIQEPPANLVAALETELRAICQVSG